MENIEKAPNVPPFVRYCAMLIPTVFDDSLSYYEALCALSNWIQKNLVEVVNNNAEVTEEYIQLTKDLKTYVDTYFDNLDVQEEVNNKLDAMVEDGTLDEIINQEIFGNLSDAITTVEGEIGDMTKLQTVNKDTLVNAINSANLNHIDELRNEYGQFYNYFTVPINNPWYEQISVFKDVQSNNYSYYFDKTKFKGINTGNTFIVDPSNTESVTTQDGSAEHPYSTISYAMHRSTIANGDTLYLKAGKYTRNQCNYNYTISGYTTCNLSINIIAEDGVILTCADDLSWTQDSEYTNVYYATRSGVTSVFSLIKNEKGVYPQLTKVTSLSAVRTTAYSWFLNSNVVYVNLGGETVTNANVICQLAVGSSQHMFEFAPTSANMNIYIENVTAFGSNNGFFGFTNNTGYTMNVVMDNCDFIFCSTNNGVTCRGTNTIFHKCKSIKAFRDGFNYHKGTTQMCNAIELDCVGAYNGLEDTNYNNNGSTTHEGNSILRINGTYFNNSGPNIADVDDGTISVNLNCKMFDSAGILTQKNDAMTTGGATMYLNNCYMKGSKSIKNISATGENSHTYITNCEYDTLSSNGDVVIE